MNYRLVARQLGLLMLVLAGCLLVMCLFEATQWEDGRLREPKAMTALGLSTLISAGLGLTLILVCKKKPPTDAHDEEQTANQSALKNIAELPGRRDAMLLVSMSWVIGAMVAALPYWFWANMVARDGGRADHPFISPIRCYFEAMSGLTTTGASVLTDIEALPQGLLLWRSLTQWLGGLGIVVLFVAVLPQLGAGGKKLFQAETTGPAQPGVKPRIRDTARSLWVIYLGLSLSLAVLLWLMGMTIFDAICHTFTTMATAGFSNHNASIGGYGAWQIDTVIIVFMVLAGINFGLYFQLLRGRPNVMVKDRELITYLGILLAVSAIVVASIQGSKIITTAGEEVDGTWIASIRYGVFTVVSMMTTTGFATADYDQWPYAAKAVLMAVMFVGGCAGSTGGGVKVIRLLIVVKVLVAEIERAFRPNVVRPIKVGAGTVSPELRHAVVVYLVTLLSVFAIGTVLIMLCEPSKSIDIDSAASAVAATLNNIGPGLNVVGPTKNFGFFTEPSLAVMCVLMALGRLELYAILALLLPKFWKTE